MVQARRYIESLQNTLNFVEIERWTGIDVIDVILNEMKKGAKGKGVYLDINAGMVSQDIGIEKKDMCSLFANLLENAVEAAKEEVVVTIKYVHRMLLVEVKNDCQVKPLTKDGRLMTRKENALCHGLGTQNIERIVRKYGGTIEYEIQENEFYVNIMMGNV